MLLYEYLFIIFSNTEAWDDAEYLYIKNNSKIYSSNIVRGRYTDDNEISPHVLNGIFLYVSFILILIININLLYICIENNI